MKNSRGTSISIRVSLGNRRERNPKRTLRQLILAVLIALLTSTDTWCFISRKILGLLK